MIPKRERDALNRELNAGTPCALSEIPVDQAGGRFAVASPPISRDRLPVPAWSQGLARMAPEPLCDRTDDGTQMDGRGCADHGPKEDVE